MKIITIREIQRNREREYELMKIVTIGEILRNRERINEKYYNRRDIKKQKES